LAELNALTLQRIESPEVRVIRRAGEYTGRKISVISCGFVNYDASCGRDSGSCPVDWSVNVGAISSALNRVRAVVAC